MALRSRTAYRVVAVAAAVAVLIVVTARITGWSLERAVYLAPVLVVGAAAVLGLLLLWGKVALESLRESRRPRLVLSLWLAGIGVLVVLTIIGVELPRE
jgi:hypothetical protein